MFLAPLIKAKSFLLDEFLTLRVSIVEELKCRSPSLANAGQSHISSPRLQGKDGNSSLWKDQSGACESVGDYGRLGNQ